MRCKLVIRTIRQGADGVKFEEEVLLEGDLPDRFKTAEEAQQAVREAREVVILESELAGAGWKGSKRR